MNYYNENDPRAAAWLRELIKAGLIADGVVDERSIEEVRAEDLGGYSQCHFFAGIGGWSYALRLAGWPDDEPVWTGSCPCQPFSVAGKGLGEKDPRHLWPTWFKLIAECRPSICFGEQVASKAGRGWLTGVFADLEGVGYAVAGADLCAAGVGAPHIRQRLWWVAVAGDGTGDGWLLYQPGKGLEQNRERASGKSERPGDISRVENLPRDRWRGWSNGDSTGEGGALQAEGYSSISGVGNLQGGRTAPVGEIFSRCLPQHDTLGICSWLESSIILCRDGKSRRIPAEPAFFPLAYGFPGRVGLLRGYGNAIVPQVAAEFIQAAREAIKSLSFADFCGGKK